MWRRKMSFTDNIGNEIHKLYEVLWQMIPSKWDEIHFNSELYEDGERICLFYRDKKTQDYHYSLLIPEEYNVSRSTFNEKDLMMLEIVENLRTLFEEKQMRTIHNLYFGVKKGKFHFELGNVNWSKSDFTSNDRMNYFRYKHCSYEASNKEEADLFIKMEEHENKNDSF